MPLPKSKCTQCDKELTTTSMSRHIKAVHDKKKEFKCVFCEFRTSQSSNLKQHSCMKRADNEGKLIYEHDIHQRLKAETKGKSVRNNRFGIVDLLTKTQIIEIKVWRDYFKAIGQVILYGSFFPDKQKRIHFYGRRLEAEVENAIRHACQMHNILVTHE